MKVYLNCVLTCLLILNSPVHGFICPDPIVIEPCTCTIEYGGEGVCAGSDVTQRTVEKFVKAARGYNGIAPNDWLIMNALNILRTPLTHLDLTPFLKMDLGRLDIFSNSNLASFSGPGSPHEESIKVTSLLITNNSLTNEGLGESLKYFSASKLQYLYLSMNNILGSNEGVTQHDPDTQSNGRARFEFLPGLSSFINLNQLDMGNNKVKKIGGGQFMQHNRLLSLYFNNNEGIEIGPNAFSFDKLDPTDPILTTSMYLFLDSCQLTELNNTENGLNNFQRPLKIYLTGNKLETLSQENFESILRAHDQTTLNVGNNNFVCDQRMKWLHDGRELFEKKVVGAMCANDPGETVFTTSLIQ